MTVDRGATRTAHDEQPLVGALVLVSCVAFSVAGRDNHCCCLAARISQHYLESLAEAERSPAHLLSISWALVQRSAGWRQRLSNERPEARTVAILTTPATCTCQSCADDGADRQTEARPCQCARRVGPIGPGRQRDFRRACRPIRRLTTGRRCGG